MDACNFHGLKIEYFILRTHDLIVLSQRLLRRAFFLIFKMSSFNFTEKDSTVMVHKRYHTRK